MTQKLSELEKSVENSYLRTDYLVKQEILSDISRKNAELQDTMDNLKHLNEELKTDQFIADNPKTILRNIVDIAHEEQQPPAEEHLAKSHEEEHHEPIKSQPLPDSNPPPEDSPAEQDTLLLIIASDHRPDYLEKTLKYVLQYHPKHSIPIVISQDGNRDNVNQVVQRAQDTFRTQSTLPFLHVHHQGTGYYENGYFKLADHFRWILNEIFLPATASVQFNEHGEKQESLSATFAQIQNVIILEEDLQIAPDFFSYFQKLIPLLAQDHQLLTISAWNDNGFQSLVKDPKAFYRSDFFPGLGWVMTRRLWNELGVKWPKAYWDDWLREPKQRQGRHILRPEISRTYHFGTRGVSNAQYNNYLQQMKLNSEPVDYANMDVSYLLLPAWDEYYLRQVREAQRISPEDLGSVPSNVKAVRVVYDVLSEESYRQNTFGFLADRTGVMNNIKANVPRTAYKGIVSCWKGDMKVFIVPKEFA